MVDDRVKRKTRVQPEFAIDLDRASRVPVYRQIGEALRQRIMNGEIPAGTPFPSQEAHSKALGVNHLTLRQALELLIEQKLVRRQHGVGTFVLPSSAWVPNKRPGRLGVVVWSMPEKMRSESYAKNLYADICRFGMEEGMEITTFRSSDEALAERVGQAGVEGLIAFPFPSKQQQRELEAVEVPKLILELELRQNGLDNVVIDCHDGVYKSVAELIRLGHRDIIYVSALLESDETLRAPQDAFYRMKAFRQAMDDAKIPCPPDCFVEIPFESKDAERLVSSLLRRKPVPTALVAFDDTLAADLMRALKARGVSVPKDMSVVGFGDIPAGFVPGELATVSVDFKEMARLAVRRMGERMANGGMGGMKVSVATRFKPGASIGPAKKSRQGKK